MPIKFVLYAAVVLGSVMLLAFLRISGLYEYQFAPIVLGLVFGGVGLALLFFDASGLLCVVLAMLPFSWGILQFEVGIVTLSPYSMGLILLSLLGAGGVLVGQLRYRFDRFDLLLGALCAFYMINTLLSSDIVGSGFLAFHSLFLPVCAYFTLKSMTHGAEEMQARYGFFTFGIVVFCLLCMVSYFSQGERAALLAVQPISIATLVSVPLFMTMYTERLAGFRGKLLFLILLVGLVLSLSRVYLAMLLISPVFLFLIRRGHAFIMFLVLMIATFALTVTITMQVPEEVIRNPELVEHLLQESMEFKQTQKSAGRLTDPTQWLKSFESRAIMYRLSMEKFLNNPIAGAGMHKGEIVVTPHNIHIEWLEFGGVLGYFFYFSVLSYFFFVFGRLAKEDRDIAALVLAVFIILCNSFTNGFMHGFFSYVAYTAFGFAFARRSLPGVGPDSFDLSALEDKSDGPAPGQFGVS